MTTAHENGSIHRTVVLQRPADLRAPIPPGLATAQELEVQERIDATMAKLRKNPECHHANLVHAPESAIETPEPKREKSPIPHSRKRLIDVQHGQAETHRSPADFRQQYPFRE